MSISYNEKSKKSMKYDKKIKLIRKTVPILFFSLFDFIYIIFINKNSILYY